MSRFATVRYARNYDHASIDIWDRFHGLLGELDWDDYAHVTPVFSPDSQLLLAPLVVRAHDPDLVTEVIGVQIVQVPKVGAAEKKPIVVSKHPITVSEDPIPTDDATVRSMAFVNNAMIAIIVDSGENMHLDLWNIDRADGSVTVSSSHTVLQNIEKPTFDDLEVMSSVWEAGTLLAIHSCDDRILFYDVTTNESLMKTLPGIYTFAFSKNGKLVVASKIGLYIYDCMQCKIGDIGEPRRICLSDSGCHEDIICFSADDTKVAVRFHHHIHSGKRIIDLHKEEVLMEQCLDKDNWDHLACNIIAN